MTETAEMSNFDEFKGKDCAFVAEWLKAKSLHKLCSVLILKVFKNDLYLKYINMCCLINHVYMYAQLQRYNRSY